MNRIAYPPVVLLCLLVGGACGPTDELERVALHMTAAQSATPFTVPDLTLTDHRGAEVNIRNLTADRFSILFFGYTHCPDICPISMSAAGVALDQLTDEEHTRVQLVFVSVDPGRDAPERIAGWLSALRSTAVGLRGSSTELDSLLGSMGFVLPPTTGWERLPGDDDAYLVPHPASLFLITPDGVGRFHYGYGRATPAEIAADLKMLMALEW